MLRQRSTASAPAVQVSRGQGGEFALRAKINGVTAPMVIDTGATSVVLTWETAKAIGLPLEKVFVSQRSSNDEYQQKMSACLLAHKARGVTACAFGDIFLEDLKRWRDDPHAR